jgi:hypothetical protein
MFERLIEYLKRSVKIAWKSIFFNFKQYIYFFVAIIIVQMFFGVLTISTSNNKKIEEEKIRETYDYHVLVTNANQNQFTALQNNQANVTSNNYVNGQDKYYVVTDSKKYNEGENARYDVYIKFDENVGSLSDDLVRFKQDYFPSYFDKNDPNLKGAKDYLRQFADVDGNMPFMYETPLLEVSTNLAKSTASYWVIVAVLFVLSVFLMTMLYNIRVNQYKFTYGVYMTYGADFKMLFNTAFWEMFVITAICFIPSVLLSTVVVFFMYLSSGIGFAFPGIVFLWVFLFSLLVVTVAVFFPMRVMAVRMPMTLIVTEDNSNLVSSPKNSKNVFQKKFPSYYETISSWRFRKYSTNLLLTAIVFCAIFIMGLYLANIFQTQYDYRKPEYKITLGTNFDYYEDGLSEDLYALDGVAAVEASDNYVEPKDLAKGSHMLVSPSKVKTLRITSPGFVTTTLEGKKMKATSGISFNAVTEEQLKVFEGLGYHYAAGSDPTLVLEDGYVIIGDSYNNVSIYKYKVGDTIYIALPPEKGGQIADAATLSGTRLLEKQIETYSPEYKAFTIAAILDDIPAGSTPIYFNTENYKEITGEDFEAKNLNVYIDPEIGRDKVESIEAKLREWASIDDISVTATNNQLDREIDNNQHVPGLFITISVMLLIISPIMWFFSQTLYYYKREQEFNILQAFGARVKDIRNIYLQGGLQMAALSLVVSVVLSYLGSLILFYVFNVIVPVFSTGADAGVHIRYTFYMPWYAILTSILVSVGCGFLSAYFPYKSYYKNRFTLENGGAGAGED